MLRRIAALTVVLGCGYLGMLFAARMGRRIRQLEGFEAVLTQLAFNIGFLALPLTEALERTVSGQRGEVRGLLEQIVTYMKERPDVTLQEAWKKSLQLHSGRLCLKQPEIEALYAFAAHLGKGDRQDALENIRLTAAKLKLVREGAQAEQARDGKLYRGLGFLSGILIVILTL